MHHCDFYFYLFEFYSFKYHLNQNKIQSMMQGMRVFVSIKIKAQTTQDMLEKKTHGAHLCNIWQILERFHIVPKQILYDECIRFFPSWVT